MILLSNAGMVLSALRNLCRRVDDVAAQREQRTGSAPADPLRDAAHDDVRQSGAPVSSPHDQIDASFACDIHDLTRRMPEANFARDAGGSGRHCSL